MIVYITQKQYDEIKEMADSGNVEAQNYLRDMPLGIIPDLDVTGVRK